MKNDLSFEKSSDVQDIHLRKLDTKPSSGNCAKYTIWISILIAIVGILAVCLNNGLMANRDRDNQSDKLVLWKKAFTNLLDKYGDALPEISQKVINKSVQSVLKRQVPSEKFNNCEPAVILLIGSKHNMQAVKCIFLELSRSVAKIFGEKQSPVLNAEKMTRIDLDNQFHDILGHQSLHSIALDGIERLKGDDALSLHPFTDHDKAPYLDVIIILTAYSNSRFTNSSLQIQQIDSIANNILELSWGQILPSEQVAGLLSRITPSVAIVSDTNESQNWHCE
uniref:Uncharacterized protein n=2 Tax=Tetranychus urticae TaxID=32264 RepID=T1KMB5_TETUR